MSLYRFPPGEGLVSGLTTKAGVVTRGGVVELGDDELHVVGQFDLEPVEENELTDEEKDTIVRLSAESGDLAAELHAQQQTPPAQNPAGGKPPAGQTPGGEN